MKQLIAFPVVAVKVHHHAFHRRGGIVALAARGSAVVIPRNYHPAAVGVKQDLRGVKAHSTGGIKRPIHAIGVKLPALHPWYKDMPVMVGAVLDGIDGDDLRRSRVVFAVEEKQLHAGGVARINAEIHSTGKNGGAKRRASSCARHTRTSVEFIDGSLYSHMHPRETA